MNDADAMNLPDMGPPGLDEVWDGIDREFGGVNLGPGHYDKSGNPISMRDNMRLWSLGPDYSRVDATTIGPYWVSTVWLGFDHGMGGPPLIFETMVFNHDTDESDLACHRYSTLEQAQAGHRATVNEVNLMWAATPTTEGGK